MRGDTFYETLGSTVYSVQSTVYSVQCTVYSDNVQ